MIIIIVIFVVFITTIIVNITIVIVTHIIFIYRHHHRHYHHHHNFMVLLFSYYFSCYILLLLLCIQKQTCIHLSLPPLLTVTNIFPDNLHVVIPIWSTLFVIESYYIEINNRQFIINRTRRQEIVQKVMISIQANY